MRPPPEITHDVVVDAHRALRDVYVAAITAARNFSLRRKAVENAELMGLARDATRERAALDEAMAKDLFARVDGGLS